MRSRSIPGRWRSNKLLKSISRSQHKESIRQPKSSLIFTMMALGLIIVLTFMLTDCLKQLRVQDNLNKEIDKSTQELALMESPDPGLAERLEKIRSEHAVARASLSAAEVNPRAIIETVLETAGDFELSGNNLTAGSWQDQNIGKNTYRQMPVDVNLRGTISNLLGFIKRLEDKQSFPSLIVQNLSLSGLEESDEYQINQSSSSEIEAKLTLSIIMRTESASGEY